MRASSLFVLAVVPAALLACDPHFSNPGGYPVPPDPRDTVGHDDDSVTTPTDASRPPRGDTSGPTDTNRPANDTAQSQDTRPDNGPGHPNGGDPNACGDDFYACTAGDDLEYCDGGVIRVADCDAFCNDEGYDYSTGCGYDEGYRGDVCWCDDDRPGPSDPGPGDPPPPPPPGCYEGWSCEGNDTLAYCDGEDTQRWSCDAYCQDQGYAYASSCGWDSSLGDEACFCEDDACTSGADVCLGSDYLETCGGSGPVTVDCWDLCRDAGYDQAAGCGYDASYGGDSCFCDNVVCGSNELTCSDGACLDAAYICDGVSDCGSGDDEWGCPATCIEGDSWCVSGYELEVCDGDEEWVYDCDDFCRSEGFDFAEGCGYDGASGYDACFCAFEPCASYEFQCGDGMCLDEVYTCDGILDCSHGEDEIGCF